MTNTFPKGTIVYCQCGAEYCRSIRDIEPVGYIDSSDFEPIGRQVITPGKNAVCSECGQKLWARNFDEAARSKTTVLLRNATLMR